MFPAFSAQIFGTQIGSKIFGLYWYGFGFANFIQFIIVKQAEEDIGFVNIFYIYTGFNVLGLAFLHIFNLKPDWSKYYRERINSDPEEKNDETLKKNDEVIV